MNQTTFNLVNVRTTIDEQGNPWFSFEDVCKMLEIRNVSQVMTNLGANEKHTYIVHTLSGDQEKTLVNESGLHSIILTLRKPEPTKNEVTISSVATENYTYSKNPDVISFGDVATGLGLFYLGLNALESGEQESSNVYTEMTNNYNSAYGADETTVSACSSSEY